MFYSDITFFLLIPPLILAIYAQQRVRSTYARYSRQYASSKISGAQAAKDILGASPASGVQVAQIPGQLTDHYDPRKKTLGLSEGVFSSTSIAALGIAAHEAGHAIQHHTGYSPLHFRNAIFPVANLGSMLAFPIFFMGLFFGGGRPSILMDIGILLFVGAVLFSVVTLPVEFNASRRAMALLQERGFLNQAELDGAAKVLKAAALTYVASTAMAVMQLVRMLLIRGSRD
ncbi:MAG: zinc metallopeptidase [Acidobacteriota bacterium]|nr:zinc metallopeptidase [Acidobacteriota bacterium]